MRGHLHDPRGWLLALACALLVFPSPADALFIVNEPWVRLAADGRSAEAYMELTSTGGATVVAARSEVCAKVILRGPRPGRAAVRSIPLAAGALLTLAPGVYRLEMSKLNRRLALGDRVALVLTIESAQGGREEIPVNAEVRRHSPTEDHLHPHRH